MRFSSLAAAGAGFLLPLVAHAQAGTQGFQNSLNLAAGAAGLQSTQSPGELAGSIINIILGLSGLVLVCLFVYAGILYMQGGQDEAKIKQAKGIILNSVIGLVLILSAYAISVFILDALSNTLSA